MGVHMATPREVIERIRREEFGIDENLDPQARKVVDNLTRRYKNLLATVAEDLNSKESHFILELIQNADDNSYPAGVAPSLAFRIDGGRLTVVNNESGFTEENVRALCSAGESSKKDKSGYIGEKGIGFKSVFKVSDAPEIHSNGYHFRFDRSAKEDLLGYVVPHWHQPAFEVEDKVTTLVLPAKPGREFTAEILSYLSDTLLLFLDKLRKIKVAAAGRSEEFTRNDDGAVTTLATSRAGEQISQRYLRIRSRVDTNDIAEPKRDGIQASDVVLAFPIGLEDEASPVSGCATYAFLPIRDFGFNFFVQADFVLISSREGIHEDLDWNLRLRDSIAAAFLEAIPEFIVRARLATSYLRFLPSTREVHDAFFAPVIGQIVAGLKRSACIPVIGGGWSEPSRVLIASDQARELFPSLEALDLFGADYPLPDFHFPAGSIEALGCKLLTPADIVSIFKSRAAWLVEKDAEWKARLFAYMATSPRRKDFAELLAGVNCIPTATGTLARPNTDTVFFPLRGKQKYGFEHELKVLDADVFDKALALSPEVREFFGELNVRQENPLELIQSHILPFHASERFADANSEAVIGHVRYVKDRLKNYLELAATTQSETEAIKALRIGLLIGSKQDDGEVWRFDRAQGLYLGKEYQPAFCIETLLEGKAPLERLISSEYLGVRKSGASSAAHAEEVVSWREFFLKIGVNDSPRTEAAHPPGNVQCSPELLALLQSESQQVRRKTLESLDANWPKYGGLTTYQTGGRVRTTYWTTFITQLKRTIAPTKHRALVPLDSSFQDNEETREILGAGTVFVDAKLLSSGFLQACGITYTVNAQACLKRLRQIRDESRGSTEQLKKIYRRLENLWPAEHPVIEGAFSSERLIRVGLGDGACWVTTGETSWNPTGVEFLDKRHPSLGLQYRDFSKFFTKLLKVPLELELGKWVDGLLALDSIDDGREREAAANSIYRRLSKAAKQLAEGQGQLIRPHWLVRFDREPLILSHRGQLVKKSDRLFANDLPEFAELFAESEEISFLSVSTDRLPSVAPLLEVLGIAYVSDAITIEVQDGCDGPVSAASSNWLRELLIPIARVVYTQSHDRFEAAIAQGAFETLARAKVKEVKELVLLVALGGVHCTTSGNVARRHEEFLLMAGAPSKVDYLAMEVSKLVRLPKSASDAVGRLLMASSMDEVLSYLSVRGFRSLPPEEERYLRTREMVGVAENPAGTDVADGDERPFEPRLTTGGEVPEPNQGNASPLPVTTTPTASEATTASIVTEDGVDAGRMGEAGKSSRPSGNEGGVPAGDGQTGDRSAGSQTGGSNDADKSPGISRTQKEGWGARGGNAGRIRRSMPRYRTRTGRLLSYAEPISEGKNDDSRTEDGSKRSEHKTAVEKAAVAFFLETAAGQWREIKEMAHNNEGFDINAVAMDGVVENIEIKGQSGAWTQEGVALTPSEMVLAHRMRDRYWLCVVEHALDESRRRLWLVRDPFGETAQFRFDCGWKHVADRVEGKPTRPEVGLIVDVPGKGKGRIVETKGKAALSRIKVELPNKSTFFTMFHPGTMALSLD
jgi:hypothetical protein